ncbi:uncharacterized protein LOC141902650 [Tubulanus polymorphus]|uniref:uncharacterized protein LOC141902650 n=1 Tax=Tubulanus polymorphus TaxID=672921 RepID=UPI003DA2AE0A
MNADYFNKILQIANSMCWTKLSVGHRLSQTEREFSEFLIACLKTEDIISYKGDATIQPLIFAVGCLVHYKDLDKAAALLEDLSNKVPIDLKVDLKNLTVEAREQAVLELCRENRFKKAGRLFFEIFQSNMVSGDEFWRSKGIIHGTVSRLQRIIMDKNADVRCKPYSSFLEQLCSVIMPLLPLENQDSNKDFMNRGTMTDGCKRSSKITQTKFTTASKACSTDPPTKMVDASVQACLGASNKSNPNTTTAEVHAPRNRVPTRNRIQSDDTSDGYNPEDNHCIADDDNPASTNTRMNNLNAAGLLDTEYSGSTRGNAVLYEKMKKTTKEPPVTADMSTKPNKRRLYNPNVVMEENVTGSKRKAIIVPTTTNELSSVNKYKEPVVQPAQRPRKSSNDSTISIFGRQRKPFTREEIDKIYRGVQKYGVGNWSKIQRNMHLANRTNVNIKDKWLHMIKSGIVDEFKLIHGDI